jgi:WS/DGAT/MGAT family acyltransferase
MRQLSGSDAFFLYTDKPGQHQHISTIYLYDQSTAPGGTVRFKSILEHIRDRLSTSRIFRQKLVEVPLNLDYPYWIEDPHFSLEFHVRHIRLPPPADWKKFCVQVSRLHSRPLDLSRPVWEMYVIEGLDNIPFLPKGSFAVVTKVHHAAIDDMTEEDFTTALHDLPSSLDSAELRLRWHPEEEPSITQLLALAWFNNTTKLLETGQALWDRLPLVGSRKTDPDELLHTSGKKAPITRFDQEITPHRVWDASFFSLEDIETINRAVPGATLNETVFTICSGALRRYLQSKEELPDSSLWALVPVHYHEEFEQGIPGHRVQLSRTRLMTDVADPLKRLAAIVEEVIEARHADTISASDMNELTDSLPSTTMTMAARTISASIGPGRRYRENHNVVLSVSHGPERPLYLCGAKLLLFTGMDIIWNNLALSHTVTTYNGKLTIAAVCDRKIMPDPAFYAQCLKESFEELLEAVS